LAALEILVHYSVLPRDFILPPIELPAGAIILTLDVPLLPPDWDHETPTSATQKIGESWLRNNQHLVLDVPSSVIPTQCNFVLNPAHPAFPSIKFLPSSPFRFDPRLK
jgi:RES domain-containing protein